MFDTNTNEVIENPNIYYNILPNNFAFDTTCFSIPNYCIKSINKEKYSIICVDDEVKKKNLKPFIKEIGLNKIEVKKENTIVQISAKILKENYSKGINLNTIEQTIHNINATGLIEIDFNTFIESTEVLKTDVATNLKLDKDLKLYLNHLQYLSLNPKYNSIPYNSNGISFLAKAKTVKERLSFYVKIDEILKDKRLSKAYRKHYHNDFKDVLRCEANLKSKKAIRTGLKINSNAIADVLTAKENYNSTLYQKIKNGFKLDNLPNVIHQNINRNITLIGIRAIIEQCGNNWNVVKAHLKSFNRNSYQTQKFKKEFEKMQLEKLSTKSEGLALLNEIETKLKRNKI